MLTTVGVVAGATPSHAAEPTGGPGAEPVRSRTVTFTASELAAVARSGRDVGADRPLLRERVSSHLDAAARSGRLVDRAEVRTTTLADPYAPGKEIHVVWTYDLYAAARPWKGYEGRLTSLNDWQPRFLNTTCDTVATVNLGGTYGGVNGSVSIPVHRCQDFWLDISASARKIGIDYLIDDNPTLCKTGRTGQMYLDVAGDYNASNASVEPIWADYNWAAIRYWENPAVICWSRSYVAKDSGW